jgi:hypothetical protein
MGRGELMIHPFLFYDKMYIIAQISYLIYV